jgi:hypothetical protein
MNRIILGAMALLSTAGALAQTPTAAPQLGGQVRLQWVAPKASSSGPLAQADALQSGIVDLPLATAALETELRASGHGLTGVFTLQQQRPQGSATESRAWVNELYASHDGGAWQFSAGKKIVSWDVGYGFRPNDIVQQDERLTLIDSTSEGRPVLMAEHFNANTAWSWVWVNPTAGHDTPGAREPALAARVYQRDGAIDWHGFARIGAHSGASVGAAMAWVASEALELHGSVRYQQRIDSSALPAGTSGVLPSDPWQAYTEAGVKQLLLGGTWTHQNQLSLLAEAWWDGTALSDQQWDAWSARNAQLGTLATLGAPASAVAGNLAWQAQAFSVAPNLRRSNAFLRLSWQHEGWQPALSLLYNPADQGRIWTASLAWQGDRMQVQGGLRSYGGPDSAVMMQLPARSQAYVASTWSF